MKQAIQRASAATLLGLLPHYLCHYLLGWPLWTDHIAEWIMARTPSAWAVPLLAAMGEWAKPFAMTGALASLGFVLAIFAIAREIPSVRRWWLVVLLGLALALGTHWVFGYREPWNSSVFWLAGFSAIFVLERKKATSTDAPARETRQISRREVLLPAVMSSGVVVVAAESYARNRILAGRAVKPVDLHVFAAPEDEFAKGLVRPLLTPVEGPAESRFYYMSKNAVDPAIDPSVWRLKITIDGRPVREFSYQQLLSLPRHQQYTTLRCVSNNLTTNLMGNAEWTGIAIEQLIDPREIPPQIVEAAVLGIDGHSDSFPWRYVFRPEVMLAVGMNGKTLNRDHGFPIRLIAPRYYGFKHIKWLDRIDFVSKPYFGYWPQVYDFTKEPVVHTYSKIDRVIAKEGQLRLGGFSFAGDRGIQRVEVRMNQGPWQAAVLERPLSAYTWVRWYAALPQTDKALIEARAMDGQGRWQATEETPLIPNGVKGPTRLVYPS